MPSIADQLQERAAGFGARLLKALRLVPREPPADTIVRQLARAGTAVAANYHATRRARSRAELISRLAVVLEETDETVHWIEQLWAVSIASGPEWERLLDEGRQLRAIFARSLLTAKTNYAAENRAGPRRRT